MSDYDYCALCGRDRADIGKLICGMKGSICHECVHLCLEILQSDPENADPFSKPDAHSAPPTGRPLL